MQIKQPLTSEHSEQEMCEKNIFKYVLHIHIYINYINLRIYLGVTDWMGIFYKTYLASECQAFPLSMNRSCTAQLHSHFLTYLAQNKIQ